MAKIRKTQNDEAKKNPDIKPMSNVDAFQRLIKILKGYPLLDVLREDEQETKPKKIETKYNAPQIIISESFAG